MEHISPRPSIFFAVLVSSCLTASVFSSLSSAVTVKQMTRIVCVLLLLEQTLLAPVCVNMRAHKLALRVSALPALKWTLHVFGAGAGVGAYDSSCLFIQCITLRRGRGENEILERIWQMWLWFKFFLQVRTSNCSEHCRFSSIGCCAPFSPDNHMCGLIKTSPSSILLLEKCVNPQKCTQVVFRLSLYAALVLL